MRLGVLHKASSKLLPDQLWLKCGPTRFRFCNLLSYAVFWLRLRCCSLDVLFRLRQETRTIVIKMKLLSYCGWSLRKEIPPAKLISHHLPQSHGLSLPSFLTYRWLIAFFSFCLFLIYPKRSSKLGNQNL